MVCGGVWYFNGSNSGEDFRPWNGFHSPAACIFSYIVELGTELAKSNERF